MNSELQKYVQDALKSGVRPEDIKRALVDVGWSGDEVSVVLRGLQQGWKSKNGTKLIITAGLITVAVSAIGAGGYITLSKINRAVTPSPSVAHSPTPNIPEKPLASAPEARAPALEKTCSLPEKIENIPFESARHSPPEPQFGDSGIEIRYVVKDDITNVWVISSASETKAQENLERVLSNFNYTGCSVVGKDGYCSSVPWVSRDFEWAAASLGGDFTVGGFNRFAYWKGKNYVIISRQIITNSIPYSNGKPTRPLPTFPDLEMSVRPFIEALDCYVPNGSISQLTLNPVPSAASPTSEEKVAAICQREPTWEITMAPGIVEDFERTLTNQVGTDVVVAVDPSLEKIIVPTTPNVGAYQSDDVRLGFWLQSSMDDAGKKFSGNIRLRSKTNVNNSCIDVSLNVEIRFRRKGEPLNGQITPAGRIITDSQTGEQYVDGQIFMIAPLGTSLETVEALAERTGGIIIGGTPDLGFYQIYYDGKNLSQLKDISAQIKKDFPEVKSVGPEYFMLGQTAG